MSFTHIRSSIRWLFLIAVTAIIFYACKKDLLSSQNEVSEKGAPTDINQWFTNTYHSDVIHVNEFYTTRPARTSSVDTSNRQQYSIRWNEGEMFSHGDSMIVEAPLTALKRERFRGDGTDSTAFPNSYTKLLIIRKGETTKAYLMVVIGDNSLKLDSGKLADVHLSHKSSTFNGSVLYYTLGGALLNGFVYINGVPFKKIKPNIPSVKVKSKVDKVSLLNPADVCTKVYNYWRDVYSCAGPGEVTYCGYYDSEMQTVTVEYPCSSMMKWKETL